VLNSAIESEVGALIGGERARQAVEDINTELRRYLTDTNRPKNDGPLHRASSRVLNIGKLPKQRHRASSLRLSSNLAICYSFASAIRRLTDPAATDQLAKELVEARGSLADARSAAQEIRRF